MKTMYVCITILIVGLFFMVSCDFFGINRNWTGSSLITYVNGNFQSSHLGIVESFKFTYGGACSLVVLDDFLTGSSTKKSYVGTYNYNETNYSLIFSLTLMEIDDAAVSPDKNYTLSGSDTFNLENESGVLTSSISGLDIPQEVILDVEFTLKAE